MFFSPTIRLRNAIWTITLLLPVAATLVAQYQTWPWLRDHCEILFVAAALLPAILGGLKPAALGAFLNSVALYLLPFWNSGRVHPAHTSDLLWSSLIAVVALVVGYARNKWTAAEMLAGALSTRLARVQDELESQRSDLQRLLELKVSLSGSLESRRLLNNVFKEIVRLQKCKLAVFLLLSDPPGRNLWVEAKIGFTDEQLLLFEDFPASFFLERRPRIEDLEQPGADFPFPEAASRLGIRSVFSAAIINSRKEPLGVVVTFFREPHYASERETRMVALYAQQAANALENASLYRDSLETLAAEQQRSAVLRALAEASVQINSVSSLDSLLQVITNQARKIIGARLAFTTLVPKGEWGENITYTSVAEGQLAPQLPSGRSEVFMLACSFNKPVRITASADSNQPWKSMLKMGAVPGGWLAAPLLTREGLNLGLIQLSQKDNGEFSEDDEAILVQLTHMASVAIENVRLYREAQEQIAQTKRAQEALQRSKESMQLAQRCVGIGIWEWDLQHGELAWSDEICRLHGIRAESFDGRYESWMESIHPEDRHRVHSSISSALSRNGEYEVQYRVIFSDQSVHWLEARGQTILMGDTPVRMLGVAMDATARKLSEDALLRSEKLAATGGLAASIAHEINNPLASVMSALYMMRIQPGLPEPAVEHVRTAESELARVVRITRQTLAFYREASAPVMTSIPGLLEEVLGAYSRKTEEKGVTIKRRYQEARDLRGFPGELRQAFSNLIVNAVEAVPSSGAISVRVRPATGPQGAEGIRIVVADNGGGIAPEHRAKVFEPFFTTKAAKGAGLGLWVSLGIIQKHGGSIRIRSSIDPAHHGTCLIVFLPFEFESLIAGNAIQSQSHLLSAQGQGSAETPKPDMSVA